MHSNTNLISGVYKGSVELFPMSERCTVTSTIYEQKTEIALIGFDPCLTYVMHVKIWLEALCAGCTVDRASEGLSCQMCFAFFRLPLRQHGDGKGGGAQAVQFRPAISPASGARSCPCCSLGGK